MIGIGASQPDMTSSRPTILRWSSSHRSEFGRLLMSARALIGGHCRARSANQPISLFQNVGICRLFSGEEAEHHEHGAAYKAYQRNFPIGASVCVVKRIGHKALATQLHTQHGQIRISLAADYFRMASRRLANGFVGCQSRVAKIYAVGLEISCPGGVVYWPRNPQPQ